MNTRKPMHRRQFLGSAAAGLAAPFIVDSPIRAQDRQGQGPNGRINIGFIGVGIMGRGHLQALLGNRGVQVVAVSDVHRGRRDDDVERVHRAYAQKRKAGTYRGCTAFGDFRELLARRDIDAVLIATPDHWHAIPAILACRARKDVYCEKPLSLTIAESRAMVKAARDNNIVFQTGSQQRTEFGGVFRRAVEYVRSARIGRVRTVRVGVGGPARPCDLADEATPDGVDWEMWNGPSPARAFNQVLCPIGIHNHFPAWRNYREYAGGGLADMGAHHFDIAQWALNMDSSGPTEIHPPERGDTGLRFVYPNGIEMFHGGPSGCTFEGTEGAIYVDRGVLRSTPATILQQPLGERDFHLPDVGNNHLQNWLDCMRTRRRPVADVEIGAKSAQVCQLANIGYQLCRPLRWNPQREKFADNAEANRLRTRANRAPWNRILQNA
ncbi:MAG: Gfo/Idh/MocA family oxidoreductase [Planctomycetes bacterium]|nr:Gfo/Idh/MocA family oxidoreductase [Planctomycetota bacterium]